MKLKNVFTVLMVMIVVLSISVTAFAAESIIDITKRGSISITLKESVAPYPVIHGATFKLYKVAIAKFENGAVHYDFTTPFLGCGVDLTDLRADEISKDLAEFADQNVTSAIVGNADEEGKVLFSDLELGLYLVVQNGAVDWFFPTDPFIVNVPMTNADGTEWVYDIDACPKVEPVPYSITVNKVWEHNGNQNRPSSITVELWNDDVLYEKIVLNAQNNWTYTWSNIRGSDKWRINEIDIPERYEASYDINGNITTITNKYNSPDPPLINTGQLNWPIPVLASCGMILMVAGWIMIRCKRKENENT